MDSSNLIDQINQELESFKKAGTKEISIDQIQKYLDDWKIEASDLHEVRRIAHEGSLAQYEFQAQANIEMFKSVLDAGKNAIQALLIINGGAVIAMLGVVSNLAGKPSGDQLARLLALPLLQFGVGVLLAAVCYAVRYFSQEFYSNADTERDRFKRAGDAMKYLAMIVGVAGYVLFGLGITNSYYAVKIAFGA